MDYPHSIDLQRRTECAENRLKLLKALVNEGEQSVEVRFARVFMFADTDLYEWAKRRGLEVEYEHFLHVRFYTFRIKPSLDYLPNDAEL